MLEVKGQDHSKPSTSNLVNTISHELLEQSQWNLLTPWFNYMVTKASHWCLSIKSIF